MVNLIPTWITSQITDKVLITRTKPLKMLKKLGMICNNNMVATHQNNHTLF